MDFWTNIVPKTYNEIVKGLLPKYTVENNMTTLKVFGSAPLEEDKNLFLYSVALDTSKDICAQITQCLYLEDWGRVEVVNEQSRTTIDLNDEIEKIANMNSTDEIERGMCLFKSRFNSACTKKIDEFRRDHKKVWLEVTKRFFPKQERAQMTLDVSKNIFKRIDRNHDGKIESREWIIALREKFTPEVASKLGLPVLRRGEMEGPARDKALIRFDEIDENGDRVLSLGEFQNFYEPTSERRFKAREALVDRKHELWNGVLERK
jgi:hypothetical protein